MSRSAAHSSSFAKAFIAATGLWLLAQTSHAAELPQRWISAGGSVSEWIVELGGESRLVAVDTTSQHPASLEKMPKIGYQRQLSAEGILALRPDLLVGSEEMGPPPVLDQLRRASVRVETLSSKPDLPALENNLKQLGDWLGKPEQAQSEFAAFRDDLNNLSHRLASNKDQAPRVLLLVGGAGDRPLVAGSDTLGAWLLTQAGANNIATHKGYKPLSSEMLLGLDPAFIVVADRRINGPAAAQALVAQNPGLANSRAVRENHLLPLDATLLVGGLGPRLPAAAETLAKAFRPSLAATVAHKP
ncbi:heme/hemin ABC transporter substrate-binding protein [Pseudomonas quasicaspiana]|uniref:heme/hemin ABC transporter substrate-binding protein n=1 Tax=Pseudomonas quasicaspiana TaxID=2829821 RepID=UPI001E511B0D|nr:ABC transporter substrate-binding protein [Pseudomonas quasicaspiana]MCD5981097.1 ABC transporter substrate-binding protein [Pseudomonas quasicaspiana]